jgi:NAD+ synthase
MKALVDTLVTNLQKFAQSAHTTKFVVGVSGGVDSAVTAAIGSLALGSDHVLALRMPHKDFSSDENLNDARAVCDHLEIDAQEIEISKNCEPFFAQDFATKTMTRGNIMARVRMVLLYALANENNGLVLGTGNKTEIMTGFFTKHGDGAVDVEVLGELWKTEVFELAKYLGLPKNVYTKPPTAELFAGQTDENEMGIKYKQLDVILQTIVADRNFAPATPEEETAFKLYTSTAHKRGETPILSRS